jgi:hypothetical protein
VTDYIATIITTAILTLSGAGMLHAIDLNGRLKWLDKFSLGFGMGSGVLSFVLQCIQLLHIPIALPLCLAPLVLGLLLLLIRRPAVKVESWGFSSFSRWEIFLIAAIIMEILWCLFRAGSTPFLAFDAAGIWGYKGKQIFLNHGIPISELGTVRFPIYHADYPLLIPLNQAFLYFFLGHFNDFAAKLLLQGFYLGTTMLFYSFSSRILPARLPRIALTFLLASVPYFSDQATNGYVDVPLAYFFFCSAILLFEWVRTRALLFICLSALNAAFAGMTKNEGFMLALVIVVVLGYCWFKLNKVLTFRQKLIHPLLFLIFLALFLLPWLMIRHEINFRNDLMNSTTMAQFSVDKIQRLGPIFWQYQKIIFGIRNWNLAWILLLGILIFRWRRWFHLDTVCLLLPAGLSLAGYTILFMITTYDLQWHLSTAASRLFLHFLPLCFFFIALAWRKEMECDKNEPKDCY